MRGKKNGGTDGRKLYSGLWSGGKEDERKEYGKRCECGDDVRLLGIACLPV